MKKILLLFSFIISLLGHAQTQFHDTKGNIEVNGSGQLQFTLPIALPPGIKSVAPQINLVYTSGSPNGLAGYGWSLNGLSSITRMGHTLDSDGQIESVKLNYSDYYALDGQRLILKSGEYGKDGAEYVTEKYSNLKIKSLGSIAGQPWKGPLYWEITFEDGSKAVYGSATPLEYNIVGWRDTQGNKINYDYYNQTLTNNTAVISSIEWGGNETLNKPHFNKIQFNYSDRGIAEESYVAGTRFVQNKILNDIVVSSSNAPFKRYAIEYFGNGTNYQLVNKITEYNADNSAANPVTFTYPSFTPSAVDLDYVANSDPFEGVRLTGDFNGDSYIDFVMSNGTVKLGAFNNDSFSNISTNKIFNTNAKVVGNLIDEDGEIYNGNGIVQYENGFICGYILRDNIFVKVFNKEVYQNDCELGTMCSITAKFENGDVDGDGIEDIFLNLSKRVCYGGATDPGPIEGKLPPGTQCFFSDIGNFIVDLKHVDNALSTYTVDTGINEGLYTEQKYLDVDNDGKVDIINVTNSAYTVFEFEKIAPNEYLKKIRFSSNLIETKDPEFPILFGDFNGDGKLDFTIPVTDNAIGKADNWRFYMGTGTGFNNFLKVEFFTYRKPKTSITNPTFVHQYFFMVADMNKDGKSDVVQLYSYNQSVNNTYRNFGYVISSRISNGSVPGGLNFFAPTSYSSPTYGVNNGQDYTLFSPLTSPIKANNNYYNVFMYWKQHLHRYKAPTSISELSRVNTINQGNGSNVIAISYLEAIPGNANIYKKVRKELYPYFSLQRLDQTFLVSQLVQSGRMQDFRYRSMTGHMQGKGMFGFYQTARSSWYAYNYEKTKVWSGVQIDPLKDGLPAKEWSIRTNDENLIFPIDISENNSQLLSFSSTDYRKDLILNGQLVTAFTDADKPKIVKAILTTGNKTKNFLTGVVNNNTIEYGDYYFPSSKTSVINNGYATETSSFTYQHNPSGTGLSYYIGHLESKNTVIQAYGDTKASKEEYTYQNNLVQSKKQWNRDNSGYVLETFNYDGFGNITQKIIHNSESSQIENSFAQYDPKGRFVNKKINNLGLETSLTYNNWGQVLTETDPIGNILTNTYDAWGKLLTSASNLGGTTSYNYSKDSNFNVIISENKPDGSITRTFTNYLGQNYKTSTKAFEQNKFISVETDYDVLGREKRKSEPYFDGQSFIQWDLIYYDDNFFPAKVNAISLGGKQVETSVTGLTTTVTELNGYTRTNSKVQDALGNIITSTDKGGTIVFKYNAIGQQIEANYQTNKITTRYDVWDRKSQFTDPSNGTYKYEYTGMGQLKKLISPKGYKEYIYNSNGQLVIQNEVSSDGVATNKNINYEYDQFGRLVFKSGTSNNKLFSAQISFDQYGRISSTAEKSNGVKYETTNFVYDNLSRIDTYKRRINGGTTTEVSIKNIYNPWDGQLYQVKDNTNGTVLWELQQSNARGQVLSAKLGASTVTNQYSYSGYLTSTNHSSQVKPGILQISYSFDAIKNELNSRFTGGDFSINESFTYDDNNRLISWTNPRIGQNSGNTYDVKGRITYNDQLGAVKFESPGKLYQPNRIELNSAGQQNYTNDLLQTVTYNENNDPIFLNGVKGDVRFEYGLTSMRQRVTYGGNFADNGDGKFTKLYSEDGSFEIIKDNIAGTEKHIIYLGGDPYDSTVVFIKNHNETQGSYKFLHKDYLGTVLAISDAAGNKLEQRHYDAWGNFTHLQIGSSAIITDKNLIDATPILLDRGYTSHEHFAEVGIIHMNGRLYDPLLRRFLNADENIQNMFNTQNYNKYGYVLNNPLMYNDPNGEFIILPLLFIASYAVVNLGVDLVKSGFKMNIGQMFSSLGKGALAGAMAYIQYSMGLPVSGALQSIILSHIPTPSLLNLQIGDWNFSLSLSLNFGQGFGIGLNGSISYDDGKFSAAVGFGLTGYGKHFASGKGGLEARFSAMAGYRGKDFGLSLGTNFWGGSGDMAEFTQQTGILTVRSGDWAFSYENDGVPMAFSKKDYSGHSRLSPRLGDGNDSYRTNAGSVSYQDITVGINLFTGRRDKNSYKNEDSGAYDGEVGKIGPFTTGLYGETYKNGLVNETGTRYRFGGLYLGLGNYRMGLNSERIRHLFQNQFAHGFAFQQRMFPMLSGDWNSFNMYKTVNQFTSW